MWSLLLVYKLHFWYGRIRQIEYILVQYMARRAVRACVRAFVRACMRVCVRVCVCAFMRA